MLKRFFPECGWYRYTVTLNQETPEVAGPYPTREAAEGRHMRITGVNDTAIWHWRRPQGSSKANVFRPVDEEK
jgi:hypothetical protein